MRTESHIRKEIDEREREREEREERERERINYLQDV